MLDSHTHLDIVGTDPSGQIATATAVGVDRLVQVGVDVDSSRWSVRLAEAQPAVLAAVALHPNDAPRLADLDEALRQIEALAAHPRVRAIGETGLDHYRTGDDGRAVQEHSFRAHIAYAKRYDRTLMIHDRDAHADILRVLDDEGAPEAVRASRGRASGALLQGPLEIGIRASKRGNEAEHERGGHRYRDGEAQGAEIDFDLTEAGKAVGNERRQKVDSPKCDEDTDRGAQGGEHQAFREELPQEPHPARAHRDAGRDFLLPLEGPREHHAAAPAP